MQNKDWGQLKPTVDPAKMNHHGLESHGSDIFGRTKFAEPIHVVTDEQKVREINHKRQKRVNTTQTFLKAENSLF